MKRRISAWVGSAFKRTLKKRSPLQEFAVSRDEADRASSLFLGRVPGELKALVSGSKSRQDLIEGCILSDQFRSRVQHLCDRATDTFFFRPGKPNNDDVDWLACAIKGFEREIRALALSPDWPSFYSALFSLPPFSAVLEAGMEKCLARRFRNRLGPPLLMRWPVNWNPAPGGTVGCLDAIERGLARGWAWNPAHPNQPAIVEFIVDGEVIHEARASYLRTDVKRDGCGSGFSGFETQIPSNLIGRDAVIGARLSGSFRELNDSPKRLGLPAFVRRWQCRDDRITIDLHRRLRHRLNNQVGDRYVSFVAWGERLSCLNDFLRTYDSLVKQWCSNWELICVAPGTFTSQIKKRCSSNGDVALRLIETGSRSTVEAIQSALSMADGTVTIPVGIGDFLEPDVTHRYLRAAGSGADLIYTDAVRTFDELEDALSSTRTAAFTHEWLVGNVPNANLLAFDKPITKRLAGAASTRWSDLLSFAIDQAKAAAHVPGLFRWSPYGTVDGEVRLRPAVFYEFDTDHNRPTAPPLAQIGGSPITFALWGSPSREIVVGSAGLLPREARHALQPQVSDEQADLSAGAKRRAIVANPEIDMHIAALGSHQFFVVLIDGDDEELRQRTLTSLSKQRYKHWTVLDRKYGSASTVGAGINRWMVFLRCGDVLEPLALYQFSARAAASPHVAAMYADYSLVSGTQAEPRLRPDWSRDRIVREDYIEGFACIRLSESEEQLSNSVDPYRLLVRLAASNRAVAHIREILMRRSGPETPVARGPDYAVRSAKSVEDARRSGSSAAEQWASARMIRDVSVVFALGSRIHHIVDADRYVTACNELTGVLTGTGCREIIAVIDGLNSDLRMSDLQLRNARVIEYSNPLPNISSMVNAGAALASGKLLLIIDEPHTLTDVDGLEVMIDQFTEAGVGITASHIALFDETNLAAGVGLLQGFPLPLINPVDYASHPPGVSAVRNVSAVMPPFMTRLDLFHQLNGYEEKVEASYCHVDFAFRASAAGHTITLLKEAAFREWSPDRLALIPDAAALRELAIRNPRRLQSDGYWPEARGLREWR